MTKWKGQVASFAPNLVQLVFATARAARTLGFPALLLLGLAASPAAAADLYWDANNTGVGVGGGGTWDTTSSLWNTTGNGVAGPFTIWNNAALDDAIFQGTVGTVTLGAPITVHNLTFNTATYTIAGTGGNTLTLAGATPTITGTATISAVIAGTAGLTKAGGGTLTLSGSNTFTGGVNVNSGSLTVTSNAALGSASNVVNLANGAGLSTGTTGGSLAGRTVSLAAGQGGINGAGAGSAHYTGAGGLSVGAVGSTGSITLSDNTNDFAGAVSFVINSAAAASFISVGNIGEASALGAGDTISLQANSGVSALNYVGSGNTSNRNWQITTGIGSPTALIQNSGTGTLTLTGNISATGGAAVALSAANADLQALGVISSSTANTFRFIGSSTGTITLGNANSFTGAASIESGIVKAATLANGGVNSSLGAGTSIAFTNGILSYTGAGAGSNRALSVGGTTSAIRNDGSGALTLSGATSLAGNLTLGGSYTGADNTISGIISGSGNLVSSGNATWVLTGANTRTGAITVSGGTLRAGSASAFGTVTDITVNGGTLDLNGNNLAPASLNGTGGTVAMGNANLTLNLGSGVNNSYGGIIAGSGASLTKLGAGTLTLTGANTYTGATTVGGGTLALDFSPAGGPTSNIISASSALVMNGGTVKITGAAGENDVQNFGGLTVTTGNNTVSATSGTGGSMTVNLGDITRTGGLANFVLPTTGAITTTGLDRALGGWATVNGTDYAKVVGGNIVAFTAADYVNQDDASQWQTNQVLSDADGVNTPFFNTVGSSIQIGGLQYTAAANSTVTVAAGQTLGVDGTIIVAPSVTGGSQTITGGSITGTLGGGVLGIQQNGGGVFTIASTIVDNTGMVGFSKAGTGKVVLSGNNTYTGATTVSQGTLSINSVANGGAASAIGAASASSSNLVIQGATLEYSGGTVSTDRGLTIARAGAVTSSTISVTNAAANLTVSGQVVSTDGANFIKDGPGTLTLAGNNSYTGTTTVNGGTLAVTSLANGGLNSSIGASSNASANLVLQNAGKLDYLGATATSNRGFTLASAGAIGVSNASTTLTLSGAATGPGRLTKTGAGTLMLAGSNNYTGGNSVTAGTLRAGSTSAFGTGPVDVASGATLDLNNFANTIGGLGGTGSVTMGTARLTISGNGSAFSGIISGSVAGGVTLTAGVQTFSGCNNSYSGSTVLQGNSTLNVGCLANGGQPSDIGTSGSASTNLVFNNGALNYTGVTVTTDRGFQLLGGTGAVGVANAATTLTFGGQAIGGGILRKDGPGTLVLSGNNTYTGGTIVTAGILQAGSTSAFGTGGMTVNAGATLDLNNLSNTVGGLAGAGNVALGSGTLTLSGGFSFSGSITGSGGLVKSGSGTQTFSGCSSSYDGSTTINGGVLAVSCLNNGGVASSVGDSSAAATNLVLNGGTLQYVGVGGSTNRQFTLGSSGGTLDASGSGAINFTSTAAAVLPGAGNRTLTLTGASTADNTLSARIDDPSGATTALTKTGTGTWVLKNQTSTYSGATTISGGVLAVDKLADGGQASSIGKSTNDASKLVIGTGSTLRYTGSGDTTDRLFTLQTGVSFIESSGTGAIVFSNTGSAAYTGVGSRTLALGGTNTGLNTMGGTIIDGPGGTTTLAKNDSGTWVLTGNNSFTGNTVINDGDLIIGNGGTSGNAGAGNVIVANATSTLSFNRSDSFSFTGTLSGLGNIAQMGTGTTILTSATNAIGGSTRIDAGALQVNGGLTSTGGTTINAGTLQSNGGGASITTPTITMNAGSQLNVGGGTVQAAGGTQTLFTGGTGGATINITGGTLLGNGTLGGGGNIVNLTAGSLNTGAAALNLGSGNDTFLLSGFATIAGAGVDGGGGSDTLQVNTTFNRTLDGAQITGFESLNKQGSATLTLTGNHSFGSGTTISGGTLQVGNGATAGSLTTPTIANNGTLAFNLNNNYAFDGAISGTGSVNKLGTGITTLTGTNAYSGTTNLNAGTLLINGNQSAATGQTNVASGATLGGSGIIGGSVTVADGGTLAPGGAGNAPGTLTINGNLALGNSILNVNFGEANVPGGAFNDLINVGGNLTLDGTLNVTQSPGGSFGPGVYRVMNYNGTLTNNTLDVSDPNYFVQTSVAKQVNLVNSAGLALSFWDGDAGPHSNSIVDGGSGTWRAAGDTNWTDKDGVFAAPFANASFAVFQGAAGTVTVDNTNGQVQAAGMQFATHGYVVQGGDIALIDDTTQVGLQSIIRVGDGTSAGAAYVATISSDLSGTTQLVKTDLGTLVLEGTNSYTGGTFIDGGTLQVGSNASLGAAAGALTFDDGMLHTTADITSARAVTLNAGGGTFETDSATSLTLTGTVGGAGALTKTAAGTLVLTGAN
ncbi:MULTISPECIES: autotransporter-associated beta strand repeat-containing protein, partial [unclassified Mesorhizobium]|uniref:autotransporter-associated beta strand repeat-containing protein n=1 Tax=unclassified Mesorhizobium TaxID=325217 RepID=UPI0015E38CF8